MEYVEDDLTRVWRQKELIVTQIYDKQYIRERYDSIPDKVKKLSELRVDTLRKFTTKGKLIDIGCGNGAFVRAACESGFIAYGYDIVDYNTEERRVHNLSSDNWNIATFFDSLEHMINPLQAVRLVDAKIIFISVPECHYPKNKEWFKNWKHRRPGEHLWHFNRESLVKFMKIVGYRYLFFSHFEDEVRVPCDSLNNILSIIFIRRDKL